VGPGFRQAEREDEDICSGEQASHLGEMLQAMSPHSLGGRQSFGFDPDPHRVEEAAIPFPDGIGRREPANGFLGELQEMANRIDVAVSGRIYAVAVFDGVGRGQAGWGRLEVDDGGVPCAQISGNMLGEAAARCRYARIRGETELWLPQLGYGLGRPPGDGSLPETSGREVGVWRNHLEIRSRSDCTVFVAASP